VLVQRVLPGDQDKRLQGQPLARPERVDEGDELARFLVVALEPADAGRTAAPAPSAPIVPAATQVAEASASSGRLRRRTKDVIRFSY